jgi:hypothetical protein
LQWFSTNRKLRELEIELDALKRAWTGVEQEWDAVQARVSKVLRRINRAEQAAAQAEDPEVVEDNQRLPLTTLGTSAERLAKIQRQLAEKER